MEKNVRREDWESLKPTVYGWGINDVNYNVQLFMELPRINGKRNHKKLWTCPYYTDWVGVLERSFCPKHKEKQQTYKDCTASEEWKYLSNFIKWVDSQPNRDWQNCCIDKDLLVTGNKVYAPDTCAYILSTTNIFLTASQKARGSCMLGVVPVKRKDGYRYRARCGNPFTSDYEHLGYFDTEMEAHKVWQEKKHYWACKLAEKEIDPRVREALVHRYSPDKDWTKA